MCHINVQSKKNTNCTSYYHCRLSGGLCKQPHPPSVAVVVAANTAARNWVPRYEWCCCVRMPVCLWIDGFCLVWICVQMQTHALAHSHTNKNTIGAWFAYGWVGCGGYGLIWVGRRSHVVCCVETFDFSLQNQAQLLSYPRFITKHFLGLTPSSLRANVPTNPSQRALGWYSTGEWHTERRGQAAIPATPNPERPKELSECGQRNPNGHPPP